MELYLTFTVFLFGLVIGSFLNVCIYRIPLGKSIVYPPSACPGCGLRLGPSEMIPVVSFIFLKGRCKHCGAAISARYPLVELATGIMFAGLFLKYSISLEFLAFAFLMSVLIAVFFIDIDHRIIPNGLVITGLVGAAAVFALNLFFEFPIYGDRIWWNPLAGLLPGTGFLLLVALLGALIYRTDEAMGMGDVKIFAPIGIFLGWKMCILAVLFSVVTGGLSGLFLMITGRKKRRDTFPFGPFIVIGTLAAILWGWDIIRWYAGTL